MPDPRTADRLPALLIVGALAAASLIIATLAVTPPRVTADELLGDARAPGDHAFIAGHRGGTQQAPENTLPAVRAALDAGYDWVEVDVTLTSDGHAVLMHDATVDRTTDGHGRVSSLSLAEIARLDAGASFSARFAGTRVPRAAEVLDLLAERGGRALLDLKGSWTPAAATALIADIERRGLERSVAVASFDARTLALVEARSSVVMRLVTLKRLPDDVVEAVRQVGARGVIVSRTALAARPDVVDELHDAGLRVVVYTLNKGAQWDAVTALGVDGIVTDDAALLASWQRSSADAARRP